MQKKISIIIPVYNKEIYLIQCIESVFRQTYHNFEIILVNDGSTDQSGEICYEMSKKDSRIKYIYQQNLGQTMARKNGLEAATSEYIAYIDADDWIESTYVETLMKPINEDDKIDLVTSEIIFEQDGTRRIQKDNVHEGRYFSNELKPVVRNVIYCDETDGQGISHSMSGKIFKKSLLEETFFNIDQRITLWEDGIAIFYYMCRVKSMYALDYAGYHYIQYSTSTIHEFEEEKINQVHLIRKNYIEIARKFEIYEDVKEQIAKHISWIYAIALGRTMILEYELQFIIPSFMRNKKSNIVIYGAGKRGFQLRKQLRKYVNINVVAWIDRNYEKFDKQLDIKDIVYLKNIEYDYILIAIENVEVVHEIICELLDRGMDYKKIFQMDQRFVYLKEQQ